MITSTQLLTALLFSGFLILVIIAFFPSYLLRFIGKLISRDLETKYKGFGSTTKDQGMDEDMVQIGTVGLIQTRK
ncbi:MAG: hypothetical protein GPJ54_18935 [Candidatus Heimdallarchaeota archaeon]|nr:hypothetical protein [Candidatus Heimdallarchaeota archaeon]